MLRRNNEKAFQIFGRRELHSVWEPHRNGRRARDTEGKTETIRVCANLSTTASYFFFKMKISMEVASFFEDSIEGTISAIESHLPALNVDTVSTLQRGMPGVTNPG